MGLGSGGDGTCIETILISCTQPETQMPNTVIIEIVTVTGTVTVIV